MKVKRVERNPWVMGAALALPAALGLALIFGAITLTPTFLFGLVHATGLAVLFGMLAWHGNPRPRLKRTELRADETTFHVGDDQVPLDAITSAYVVPRASHATVHIRRRRALPVELRVSGEMQGRQVLSLIGMSAEQTVATFSTFSKMLTSQWKLIAVFFGMMFGGGLASAFLGGLLGPVAGVLVFGLVFAAVMTMMIAPTKIDVGVDGVLIRWLGTKQFISHRDIAYIVTEEGSLMQSNRTFVVVHLTNGKEVRLAYNSKRFSAGLVEGMAARIRHAKEIHDTGGDVADAAVLKRGDRAFGDWVNALRAGTIVASHRSAPLERDHLWRIVENASAEPMGRAAAAVALSQQLDGKERRRLQRIATSTAAPKLRVCLEAVAAEDEAAAIAEALQDVEKATSSAG